ncbi:MAG: hypothetical protein AB7U98_13550 [Candidatus Nitrosocosmicus sp.]
MALFRPELWVQSGYPGNYTCTFKVAAYVESDPGAVTQVIISRNWSAANEGIVLYYDNTTDQMSVVWFKDGGATFEQAVLASRPALNEPFIAYLQSSSSTVKGGYALLSNPTVWVSNQTTNPLPTPGTDNAINLSSNANGAYITAQNWCGWNELLSEATLSGEIYSRAVYRTNLVFEHKLNDGDVTSPWPDSSGNANDATQQGGLAPTNRANFLLDPPSAFALETVKLRGRRFRGPKTAYGRLDIRDWAPPALRVESWFAEELRASAGGGGITAVASDSITLSDSAAAITTRVAVASDTLSLTDSAVGFSQRVAAASDSIALSDSAVAGVTQAVTASDSISLSDSAVAVVNAAAAASDTLSLSDSAVAVTNRVAEASDSLSLSDSAVAVSTLVASASDSVTLSDSAAASRNTGARPVTASDSISLSDSATAITTRVAEATDSVTLGDSATAVTTRVASASDSITLTDSAVASLGAQTVTVVASDTITFSDSAEATRVAPEPPSQAGGFGGGGHRGWDGRSRKRELEEFLDRAFREYLEVPAELARPESASRALIRMAPDLAKVEALVSVVQARETVVNAREAAQLREIERRLQQYLDDEEEAAVMSILF